MSTLLQDKPKRQRVSVACLACRRKRMRCDGTRPNCNTCIQRGAACEYQVGESNRKPPSKRYVESLHVRIKVLEAQLAAVGGPVDSSHQEENLASDEEDGGSPASDSKTLSEMSHRDPLEELTDLTGRLNVGEDGQLRFFGPQSNYHLLRGAMGESTTKPSISAQQKGLNAVTSLGKHVSVSEELEEHLLELYWTWQNSWNYVVHKAAFLEEFRRSENGVYCTPLLLSAIFALASRYSDRKELRTDPDDPNSAGVSFAEQAHVLLLYDIEAPTTATVQAAALLGLRAMAESKEAKGWLYIGMATRMAFNLGLNLDCSTPLSLGLLSEQDFEVRKVTWWGCYTLDKLFAIGFGRPGTTRGCDITCPKPTAEYDAEFEPWVPLVQTESPLLGAHSRIVSTSQYMCQVFVIATEALDQIYAPQGGLSRIAIENIVAKADVALQTFHTALPSHLRLPVSTRTPTLPHIYQLHIQYHVMQILLHRPLIRNRYTQTTMSPMSFNEKNEHMETCRHSAREITRLLRAYRHHYTLRLIHIVGVHNTFTAAVIHLLDSSSPDIKLRREGIRHLQICTKALQEMSVAWSWGARALRGLKLLACEWMLPASCLGKSDEISHREHVPSMATPTTRTTPDVDDGMTMGVDDAGLTDDVDWLFEYDADMETQMACAQDQMDLWLVNSTKASFGGFTWDSWEDQQY